MQLRGLARLYFAPKTGAYHISSRLATLGPCAAKGRGVIRLPLFLGAVQHDYTGGINAASDTVCALNLANLYPLGKRYLSQSATL